ncbi:unnamed protein product [Plutella xylostella]|uniref:(diamondback moth) hypothetical protein n=1 Tax=Plutella xylostella TaxID=51655 RepID=A0A8S4EWE8_PLUXY|nr:unnamed protein product [Plutella xylostella]
MELDPEDNICWECRAILAKVSKFVQLAHRSSTVLRCLSQLDKATNYGQRGILVQSLSTLTQSKPKDTYNAIYRHEDEKQNSEPQNMEFEYPRSEPQKLSSIHAMYVNEEFVQPKKEIVSLNCEFEIECGVKQEQLDTMEDGGHAMPYVIAKELPPATVIKQKTAKRTGRQKKSKKTKSTSDDDDKSVEQYFSEPFEEPSKDDDVNDDSPKSDEQQEYVEKILNEQEMLAFREKMKEFRFYKTSPHRCVKCLISFASEKMLYEHNTLHSENLGPFSCRICEQRFPVASDVDLHIKTHYIIYVCSICAFEHYQAKSVTVHIKRTHDTRVIKCKKCDAEFVGQRLYRYHKLSAHNKLTCLICFKKLSALSMKRHMLQIHGNVQKVECPVCRKLFPGELRLKNHMETHSQKVDEDAFCAECGIQFRNRNVLKAHLKFNKRHNGDDQLKYECDVCEKRTATKTAMQYHIEAEHLKLANYVCDICNKQFHAERPYKRHLREKHSSRVVVKSNVCHVCGKAFAHRKSLNEHMNRHTGLRPYECKICGATFGFHSALYTHNKLVHLKQRRVRKKKNDDQ